MKVTTVFERIWNHPLSRINALRGSARSSKTTSLIQIATLWLLTGKIGSHDIPKGTFGVCRKTFPALRASALKDFENYLKDINIYHLIEHKKTYHEFRMPKTKREIIFFSVDDEHKIRGREFDLLWLNEADGFDFDDFTQMLNRTTGYVFMDYNPANSNSYVRTLIEEKRAQTHGDVKVHVSTYLDNPFLPDMIKKELDGLKHTDLDLWRVYAKGQWARITGSVFQNYTTFKDEPEEFDKEYIGLDFGFSSDPAAALRVRERGKDLFATEIFYKTGMLNPDIYDELSPYNLQVIADDPGRNIVELRKMGLRIRKVVKKGTTNDSYRPFAIKLLKQHNLFVHEGSKNLQWELQQFKYVKRVVKGVEKNVPMETNDHLIDAWKDSVSMMSSRTQIKLLV